MRSEPLDLHEPRTRRRDEVAWAPAMSVPEVFLAGSAEPSRGDPRTGTARWHEEMGGVAVDRAVSVDRGDGQREGEGGRVSRRLVGPEISGGGDEGHPLRRGPAQGAVHQLVIKPSGADIDHLRVLAGQKVGRAQDAVAPVAPPPGSAGSAPTPASIMPTRARARQPRGGIVAPARPVGALETVGAVDPYRYPGRGRFAAAVEKAQSRIVVPRRRSIDPRSGR